MSGGLLYYMQSNDLVHVNLAHHEVRGLLITRNDLVSFSVSHRDVPDVDTDSSLASGGLRIAKVAEILPPTINDKQVCSRCYAVQSCMVYKKVTVSYPCNDFVLSIP